VEKAEGSTELDILNIEWTTILQSLQIEFTLATELTTELANT